MVLYNTFGSFTHKFLYMSIPFPTDYSFKWSHVLKDLQN